MIEIIADISSLMRNTMGSITGRIFLRGPTGDFPTNQWCDFPVVILGWWIAGLTSVAVGDARLFQGLFMDGSVRFRRQTRGEHIGPNRMGTPGRRGFYRRRGH